MIMSCSAHPYLNYLSHCSETVREGCHSIFSSSFGIYNTVSVTKSDQLASGNLQFSEVLGVQATGWCLYMTCCEAEKVMVGSGVLSSLGKDPCACTVPTVGLKTPRLWCLLTYEPEKADWLLLKNKFLSDHIKKKKSSGKKNKLNFEFILRILW